MRQTTTFSTDRIERLARAIESVIEANDPSPLIGGSLDWAARGPSEEQLTPGAVLRLSLLSDSLCLAERALEAGELTTTEVDYLSPLVGETRKYLGRLSPVYREPGAEASHGVQGFLARHAADDQKFGGRCPSTAWMGLSLCQRAAALTGDGHFVDEYRGLAVRLLDDLFDGVGSVSERTKQEVVQELDRRAPPVTHPRDPRDAAYCSPASPDVFHAIAHGSEVFTPDRFDVEEIHAEARAAFARLVDRSADAQFGRLLLVKGVSGSGKTHLMRAFRDQVHGEQRGFAAYLQMSTRATNYARYLLANVIDSWDRPYWGRVVGEPALSCLSDSLGRDLSPEVLERLRDEDVPEAELHFLVNRAADELSALEKLRGSRRDVLRVLLYLQRRDPARRARVSKYLRCEPLTAQDSALLGDTPSTNDEQAAARMLAELGRLVASTGNGALVLLVDQLEDSYDRNATSARFRAAMDALRHLADHVPTSVIVIACLDDFYFELRDALARPVLDRLERDPEPVQLTANRSLREIEQLLTPRLAHLYERQNVQVHADQPLFPFTYADLEALVNQRTRDVLDWCRSHHEASIRAGGVVIFPPRPGHEPAPARRDGSLALEQEWNDHIASSHAVPRDEADMVSLVAWALGHIWREVPGLPQVQAHVDGTYVDAHFGEVRLGLALCDRHVAGGALGKQVDALRRLAAASGSTPILLRSCEFPRAGAHTSQVAEKLKLLLMEGGRRVSITDAEWRRMLALKLFLATHEDSPDVDLWLERETPLAGLAAIREILELDTRAERRPPDRLSLRVASPSPSRSSVPPSLRTSLPPPPLVYRIPRAPVASGAEFVVGHTRALQPRPVEVSMGSFVRHAAFVGSPNGAPIELALNALEHLLALGVPAVLLDQEGDLCRYGAREFWREEAESSQATARKRALHDAVDVCVFTPGEPRGRALGLSLVPSGLAELPAHERAGAAYHAACALGALLGYGKAQADQARVGILSKALELHGALRAGEPDGSGQPGDVLSDLVALLHAQDPVLVAAVGRLDTRHFRSLVENLETLRFRYDHLLRSGGEQLSPELLLGLGAAGKPGRTRLSIISTRFMGDAAAVQFWVSRLLGELGRFAARSSADALSAVLFIDAAHLYLPAEGKPASKDALLGLLERGRAGGLGVMLATERPGDLDYRCRDSIRSWYVGKVAERSALDRMKPLLSDCRINVGGKLADVQPGELFKLEDGEAIELRAAPALMKRRPPSDDEIRIAAQHTRLG